MSKLLFVIAIVSIGAEASAQLEPADLEGGLNLPLGYDLNWQYERIANHSDSTVHTGMRPYIATWIGVNKHPTRFGWEGQDNIPSPDGKSWVMRKIRHESFINIQDKEDQFVAQIDGLFNWEFGEDVADDSGWADMVNFSKNTRGVRLQGYIGKRFSWSSSFIENQAYFPRYMDARIRSRGEYYDNDGQLVQFNGVVPGQGRTKQFKTNGFDYAYAAGYISYSPHRAVNLQFGTGKHFVGEGYRSLLLSDNAFNYPHIRTSVRFLKDKLQYTSILASLSSLYRLPRTSTAEALYQPKSGSFHYLTYVPHKAIQLGLFEGVIWQRWDTAGSKPFNAAQAVPALGIGTLLYGLDHEENNTVLGFTASIKPHRDYTIYGQFMLDGPGKNGWQIGAKAADVAGIKNLFLLAEYNRVAPFAYGHSRPLQNYSHFNQALAHPLGASFRETVAIAQYRWRDWFTNLKVNVANYEKDVDGTHLGMDIFQSEDLATDRAQTRGIYDLRGIDFSVGYRINPATNMNIVLGVIDRLETGPTMPDDKTRFVYAGVRTSLSNAYYDF